MKPKFFLLFFVTLALSVGVNAQVTIGSIEIPDSNALLDLRESVTTTKGVLPPRVALISTGSISPMSNSVTTGMTVFNTSTQNDVKPGYYYYNGVKWVRLATEEKSKFFYMPSIVLPVDPTDPANSGGIFTIDLYTKYYAQFNTPESKNLGASVSLPVYANNELNYYITYYDHAVFNTVTVDNNGVLKYSLVSNPSITEKSYMNIVFEVK